MKFKRKNLVIVLILVFISILGYLFIRITNPTMKAIVINATENYLLVMDEKDQSPLYIGLPNDTNLQLKQGQEVLIYFEPVICKNLTYPASIDRKYIKKIRILKEKSNIRNSY